MVPDPWIHYNRRRSHPGTALNSAVPGWSGSGRWNPGYNSDSRQFLLFIRKQETFGFVVQYDSSGDADRFGDFSDGHQSFFTFPFSSFDDIKNMPFSKLSLHRTSMYGYNYCNKRRKTCQDTYDKTNELHRFVRQRKNHDKSSFL